MTNHIVYQCARCRAEVPDSLRGCPQCGSEDQLQILCIKEDVGLEIHDGLDGRLKDPSLRAAKKLRVRFFAGSEQRKSDGKWMNKGRIIDRDNDKYKEVVTDPVTGEIIRKCDEPLSTHQGHGSAKKVSR